MLCLPAGQIFLRTTSIPCLGAFPSPFQQSSIHGKIPATQTILRSPSQGKSKPLLIQYVSLPRRWILPSNTTKAKDYSLRARSPPFRFRRSGNATTTPFTTLSSQPFRESFSWIPLLFSRSTAQASLSFGLVRAHTFLISLFNLKGIASFCFWMLV